MFLINLFYVRKVVEVEIISVLCHRKSGHINYTNSLDKTDSYVNY